MALALFLLVGALSFFLPSSAELQSLEHPLKHDGYLSLLVIGDWGRKGENNQSHVATQVGINSLLNYLLLFFLLISSSSFFFLDLETTIIFICHIHS